MATIQISECEDARRTADLRGLLSLIETLADRHKKAMEAADEERVRVTKRNAKLVEALSKMVSTSFLHRKASYLTQVASVHRQAGRIRRQRSG